MVKEFHGLIGIEKAEFLPGFPKLRMEPVPFRGIEMGFGFGEKVLVIMHGLPVLDHSNTEINKTEKVILIYPSPYPLSSFFPCR